MKVLHLNTSDTSGGAARAAYRLHSGLQSCGIESRMLVQQKNSKDSSVYGSKGLLGRIWSRIRREIDQLPLKRYWNRDPEIFSPAWIPELRSKQIARHDPDIVHLHWIGGGFMDPSTIGQLDVPVVWTLHDMWPFTGGCHYSKSCTKYQSICHECPHLGSDRFNDLANRVWKRKYNAWDESDFTVVAPSKWIAQKAQASSLLGDQQMEIIHNGLDLDAFRPHSRSVGIQRFNLDEDKHYLLFGAAYETSRKGGDLLCRALKSLEEESNIVALTFGDVDKRKSDFSIPVRHMGYLSEEELRLAYSTADLTIIPSREDNLPNVAVESIASGTPCVAFNIGGISDIIVHRKNGYLAEAYDVEDLANGINWILSSGQIGQLSKHAYNIAQQRFSLETAVGKYSKVYNDIT